MAEKKIYQGHERDTDTGALNDIQARETVFSSEDNFKIYKDAGGTPRYILTMASKAISETSGNIGIGVASADEKLEIQGPGNDSTRIHLDSGGHATLKMDAGGASYNSTILFEEANVSKYAIYYQGNDDALVFFDHDNGNQDLTIKAGNVGINDTTPSYKLDLNGDARVVTNLTVGKLLAVSPVTQSLTTDNNILNSDVNGHLIVDTATTSAPTSYSSGLKAGTIDGQICIVKSDDTTTSSFEIINGIGGTATILFPPGSTKVTLEITTAFFVWTDGVWNYIGGNGVLS